MADTEADQKVKEWARREKLSPDIVKVLDELGFDTMETLRLLTIDEMTESIQKPNLLPLAKCLQLKKALKKLSTTASPDLVSPGGEVVTYVAAEETRDPAHLTGPKVVLPSDVPWQTIKPQPGQVSKTRAVFEGVKNFIGWESKPEQKEYFRFLLLGKTGSGKSSTGNTILGEKLFTVGVNFNSVTRTCQLRSTKKGKRVIDIMDSPGLYDTSLSQEEICMIIVQAVACMHPGPHAILYVVKMGRYTEEEYNVYKRLKALFDEHITKYMIILFTGGDELEATTQTLADVLKSAPKELIQVVEECSHRCIVFNNKAKDKQPQVDRLLDQVRKNVAENKGNPYACPKYASVGEGLEYEVARRLAEVTKQDLEREQYIRELEEKKKEAEQKIKRHEEAFRKKEEEIRQEREKREREKRELEEQLETKERELKLQEERKLAMVKEEERKREEERTLELAKQQEELRRSIQRREVEQKALLQQLEEERKREREEKRKREQEREEIERMKREQDREEEERKKRAYEEQMRRMKEQIAENKEPGWIEWAAKGVSNWFSGWW